MAKNKTWKEAAQLAIHKLNRGVVSGTTIKQLQLLTCFNPGPPNL